MDLSFATNISQRTPECWWNCSPWFAGVVSITTSILVVHFRVLRTLEQKARMAPLSTTQDTPCILLASPHLGKLATNKHTTSPLRPGCSPHRTLSAPIVNIPPDLIVTGESGEVVAHFETPPNSTPPHSGYQLRCLTPSFATTFLNHPGC